MELDEAYFTEIQNYVIAPETGVTQEFSFDGCHFDLRRKSIDPGYADYLLGRIPRGSHAGVVTITSRLNPRLSYRARLEVNDLIGRLVVENEGSWNDPAQWGATPFTNKISVQLTLQPGDENHDLTAAVPSWFQPVMFPVTIVKWRIQHLQAGTRLWVWPEDHCCNHFQSAIVTTVNDHAFQYQLSTSDSSQAATHTVNIHVGYHSKVFRVLASLQAPQRDILMIGNDHKLYNATVSTNSTNDITLPNRVSLESGETISMYLDNFNHSTPLLTPHEFRRARLAYCKFLCENKRTVTDGLTGRELEIENQTLKIGLGTLSKGNPATFSACASSTELAKKVWDVHNSTPRHHGGVIAYSPVVICSKAGCGKTWASHQIRHVIAKHIHSTNNRHGFEVPLLIPVQQLVGLVETQEGFRNLLHRYVASLTSDDVGEDSKVTEMLQTAIRLKSTILIVDGVDEAGGLSRQMEQFVLRDLILNGHTVVATSRPEGLRIMLNREYSLGISVLDLLPLTDKQQRKLIGQQCGQGRLIESLHGASEVAKLLDREWRRICCTSPSVAEALQRRGSLNLHTYPCQQIVTESGLRTIRANHKEPLSGIIRVLQIVFTTHLLAQLEEVLDIVNDSIFDGLEQVKTLITDGTVAKLLQNPQHRHVLYSYGVMQNEQQSLKVTRRQVTGWVTVIATQLVVLSRTSHRTPLDVWNDITAETDELYHAVEHNGCDTLLQFTKKLIGFCPDTSAAVPEHETRWESILKVGLNRNPVRLYDFAVNEYSKKQVKPAAAYASNAIRASMVLVSLADIEALLDQWPTHVTLGNGKVIFAQRLSLQNFFSSENPDPLHIRRVGCRLQLQYNGVTFLAELEIHHRDILRTADAHKVHVSNLKEYCRVRFRESSSEKVRRLVDTYRTLYADVAGNPVQLSLLGHVMVHDVTADPPQTVLELYQKAMQSILHRRLKEQWGKAQQLLKIVAVHLVVKGRAKRIFHRADVVTAGCADGWDWLLRVSKGNIPLIKRLDVDRFEFQHRSFQEALFVEALSEDEVAEDEFMSAETVETNWKLIESGALANVWRIGGHSLGDVLKRGLGQPKDNLPVGWNPHVWWTVFNSGVAAHSLAFVQKLSASDTGISGLYRAFRCVTSVVNLGFFLVLNVL